MGSWILRFLKLKKQPRYAKRQLTWYRKADDIHYLQLGYSQEDFEGLIGYINEEFKINFLNHLINKGLPFIKILKSICFS
jgi:hypothetical protein